jgi:hypothetical protein
VSIINQYTGSGGLIFRPSKKVMTPSEPAKKVMTPYEIWAKNQLNQANFVQNRRKTGQKVMTPSENRMKNAQI